FHVGHVGRGDQQGVRDTQRNGEEPTQPCDDDFERGTGMTLDERIRQDLNSAAGLSPSAEMAPVETVMATGKRRRRRKSGTAVGLAATLTIGAVLMTQPIPPLTPEALAGDAEILKSDPLAVRGEESPR